MTLLSPGVQVSIIDQSNYIPGATNSVPFILLATAQNKISGAGAGVASGTLAANANKTYLMTSQRDLLNTFGNPFFYNTTAGTPINGYELNEYGLLAAYSALGVTNQCYVQRVNVDLAALTASLTRPVGVPNNNTYWLNTTTSNWGIFEWNVTTGAFTNQIPSVITSTANLVSGETVPLSSYGSIGNYAVVAAGTQTANVAGALQNPEYYKRGGPTTSQTSSATLSSLYNSWVAVGSDDWKTAWPSISGTQSPTTLTANTTIRINNTNTITVPAGANATVSNVSTQINSANIAGVYSGVIGGALFIYADSTSTGYNGTVTAGTANIVAGTATLTFTNGGNVVPTPYPVGSTITVTGTSSSNYDGTYDVIAASNTSVTFSFAGANIATSGGTITWPDSVSISGTALTTLGMTAGAYSTPQYLASNSYQNPRWTSTSAIPSPTGSIWQKINNVNLGTNLVFSSYSSTLGTFVQQNCPVYANDAAAFYALDPAGGGYNIAAGITYAQVDAYNNGTGSFMIWSRYAPGATNITGYAVAGDTFVSGNQFTIAATQAGSTALNTATATLEGTTPSDFCAAVSAAGVPYVSATINSLGYIVFTHSQGGDIQLTNISGNPVGEAGFALDQNIVGLTALDVTNTDTLVLSNWVSYPTFTYISSGVAPDQNPLNGTYWYYSDTTQVDIMIQNNGQWVGYQTVNNDIRGYNLSQTNATGPQISTTAPTTQNNTAKSPLVYGDLWIDTSNLDLYPVINRWENVNGQDQWVQLDNTNQTTSSGVLFADARWAPNGTTDPVADALPTITSLLISNYLDPDAPSPSLYPDGMLLWNTRRSGFNVKTFELDYFNNTAFPAYPWYSTTAYSIGNLVSYNSMVYICMVPNTNYVPTNTAYWQPITVTNTWKTASGNRADGSPHMGRQAQRAIIVAALRSGIDANTTIREEQNQFNLLACPQYPELVPNLAVLNVDRGQTGFVVADTPLRLTPDEIVTWATNNNGLGLATADGNLDSGDAYAGAFYPSCTTTDLSGNLVVTAPSHMMIRTIIRSDSIAYPWLAPAGTRRGVIDNATQIGYIVAQTGEFMPLGVNQGLRDVLYQNDVNPITFIPGVGITNFGNHTLQGTATALDRINVARLVAYLRARLSQIGKTYLFEPNDTITRQQITNAITNLMIDLVAKRGIYDYLVVCDLTNNTPARIDANELWVDIAIEPVKAVEFIYIPVRIQNTGTIQAQTVA
jgi:Phage tail sheath C-terminal domain